MFYPPLSFVFFAYPPPSRRLKRGVFELTARKRGEPSLVVFGHIHALDQSQHWSNAR